MLYIILFVFPLLLSFLFRLAAVLRLTIPLLYALLAPVLLRDWYLAHTALADRIFFLLLALAGTSWVLSLLRRLRS